MGKFQFSTLQANAAVNGDFSSSDSTIDGLGIGIYVGVTGDVTIQIVGANEDGPSSLLFTGVPQGTFMQVPLFKQVLADGTTSTDLTISYMKTPYR